ncbi:MAG: STAS domain-containing protein [Terriglobales bacterium]
MPITLAGSERMCVIRLEGEVNVASAAELKKLLLEALASQQQGEVRVDLKNASELDISILQLLSAAEREARASGKGFSLAGGVPEGIAAAVAEAGFERFPVPPDQSHEIKGLTPLPA